MPIKFLNDVAVDSNVLYVDTTNDRVGIGTGSPTRQLTIFDSTGSRLALTSGSSANCNILFGDTGDDDKGSIRFDNSNSSFEHRASIFNFKAQGSSALYINSSGNVGIGTTSPSQKLDVNGNVAANRYYGSGSTTYYVDPNSTSQAAYLAGDIRITDAIATIKLDSTNIYPSSRIIATKNGSESPPMGGISWNDNPGFQGSIWNQLTTSSPYTESSIELPISSSHNFAIKTLGSDRMVIDSSGDVGFGTTSPSRILHAKADDATLLLQDSTTSFTSQASGIILTSSDGSGNPRTDVQYKLKVNSNTFEITYGASDSQRLKIDSSGDVGIGTTSPDEKLHVYGTLKVEDTSTSTSSFAIIAMEGRGVMGSNTAYLRTDSNGDFSIAKGANNMSTSFVDTTLGSLISSNNTSSGNDSVFEATQQLGGPSTNAVTMLFKANTDSQTGQYNEVGIEVDRMDGYAFSSAKRGKMRLQTADNDHIIMETVAGDGFTSTTTTFDQNCNFNQNAYFSNGARVGSPTIAASFFNAGTLRYRTSGNNSYVDMSMQTGASTYAWVNIVQNSW